MAHDGALRQESFVVSAEGNGRKKIVRQDRWTLDQGQAKLHLMDSEFEVVNLSAFGCAALCTVQQGEFFRQMAKAGNTISAALVFQNIEVQTLSLRPVRVGETESSSTTFLDVGFETAGEPLRVERCKAIELASLAIAKQNSFNPLTLHHGNREFASHPLRIDSRCREDDEHSWTALNH